MSAKGADGLLDHERGVEGKPSDEPRDERLFTGNPSEPPVDSLPRRVV
jgi:hypothetical protein